mmetsp:Transcript_3149/g.3045  ORF Transcript_3149/g.3045 Transcript_3149/m.3045 type:complete len:95 (+) Transcript_3149:462-746(+)
MHVPFSGVLHLRREQPVIHPLHLVLLPHILVASGRPARLLFGCCHPSLSGEHSFKDLNAGLLGDFSDAAVIAVIAHEGSVEVLGAATAAHVLAD